MQKKIITALGICALTGAFFFGASNAHAATAQVAAQHSATQSYVARGASNQQGRGYGPGGWGDNWGGHGDNWGGHGDNWGGHGDNWGGHGDNWGGHGDNWGGR